VRLLLDENVHLTLVPLLIADGHDVKHIVIHFAQSDADTNILEIARLEDRVIITNDRDFGGLVYGRRLEHRGIIYLRLYRLPFITQVPLVRAAIALQETDRLRFTVVNPAGPR
jgi:predicted nuclease of predicted toxin-antitoxin system